MDRIKQAGIAVLAGVTLVATGCGGGDAANKIADKAAEKIAEQNGSGKVDIDTSNGKVKVKTQDGSFEVDQNGSVKASGKQGDSTYQAGTGTELPEGWPSELEPPKGSKLLSSSSTKDGGQTTMMIVAEVSGSVKDTAADVKKQLEAAGVTLSNQSSGSMGGNDYDSLTGTSDSFEVQVAVSSSATSSGKSTLTMTVRPS